jgi:hypothetical protein
VPSAAMTRTPPSVKNPVTSAEEAACVDDPLSGDVVPKASTGRCGPLSRTLALGELIPRGAEGGVGPQVGNAPCFKQSVLPDARAGLRSPNTPMIAPGDG